METVSLETMDGYEFQKFVGNLFKKLGFENVEASPPTADGGIDISMEQETDVGAVHFKVECKHHPESSIGRPVVEKLHSAVMHTPTLDKGICGWHLHCAEGSSALTHFNESLKEDCRRRLVIM